MRDDVAHWLRTRSYPRHPWSAAELLDHKAGRRVSVVLPARDEAGTVGPIVAALRTELVERIPLIDELVVIDSDSTDGTGAIAAAAGARVERQADILPELGNIAGKGEALWKSLAVTRGEILAFVDADLHDFDPRFVVGLLGPLLLDPGVRFVKGFYDRPLETGLSIAPTGGGRVTELVARPLLNMHWPALSGLIQPLAGEYAGRRDLLERLPFVSGYGVEIAMLVDVLAVAGLDAIAQVDLGARAHRNSSDAALARMAVQVQLAALSRLTGDAPGRVSFTQFFRSGDEFLPETHEIAVVERPPILEVPGYHGGARAERVA